MNNSDKEINKKIISAKADAFFSVGEILKYEYEGPYDRSSIEEFFDNYADNLLKELDKE